MKTKLPENILIKINSDELTITKTRSTFQVVSIFLGIVLFWFFFKILWVFILGLIFGVINLTEKTVSKISVRDCTFKRTRFLLNIEINVLFNVKISIPAVLRLDTINEVDASDSYSLAILCSDRYCSVVEFSRVKTSKALENYFNQLPADLYKFSV